MIPSDVLSTVAVPDRFVEDVGRRSVPLIDYEMGGTNLQAPEDGLQVQLWTAEYKAGSVYISASTHPESILFTRAGITEVSLAFDQNMRPAIAFEDGAGAWLWWFDATLGSTTFISIPGATNPRITTDEKRSLFLSGSDIILAYIKDNDLCYRQQRDRFLTERVLATEVNAELLAVGMNLQNRLQFRLREL